MNATSRPLAALALSLLLCSLASAAFAADNGLITVQSRYSVKETVARFEFQQRCPRRRGIQDGKQ